MAVKDSILPCILQQIVTSPSGLGHSDLVCESVILRKVKSAVMCNVTCSFSTCFSYMCSVMVCSKLFVISECNNMELLIYQLLNIYNNQIYSGALIGVVCFVCVSYRPNTCVLYIIYGCHTVC